MRVVVFPTFEAYLFLNDLFYVDMSCDIAKYAEDNRTRGRTFYFT